MRNEKNGEFFHRVEDLKGKKKKPQALDLG